ncbi:MAG: alpha/beta hydrolase [Actinomycetia bacterium]|nr:alpha/beta hydrolase [Actinomycetes bacterium]
MAPPGCKELALEVIAQAAGLDAPRAVLVCFPGGGMTRRYFDLPVPGYSFARYASARGFLVVLADHPGTGDSDAPDDGWSLTPKAVAGIEAAAVDRVLAVLRAGDVDGIPPLAPAATVIGVAHSMGAHLLIHQAALLSSRGAPPDPPARLRREPSGLYAGLVLLGWGGHGLPEYLDPADRTLGELDETDPVAFARELVTSARRRFHEPFPVMQRGRSQLLVKNALAADVRQALAGARAPLLAIVGHASMIPGSAKRAAAAVDVPVFLGVGEHDIATSHHLIPNEFPASDDITLYVLPGAGHNQNVEPRREELWKRVTSWADQLAADRRKRKG